MANSKAMCICHEMSKTRKNAITVSFASKSFIVYPTERHPAGITLWISVLIWCAHKKIHILDVLSSEEYILELICEGQKLSKERVGFFFSPEREPWWLLLKLMLSKDSIPLAVGWILIVFRMSYLLQKLKHIWGIFKKDVYEARKIRPSNLHFVEKILFRREERCAPGRHNGLHPWILSRGKRQVCEEKLCIWGFLFLFFFLSELTN